MARIVKHFFYVVSVSAQYNMAVRCNADALATTFLLALLFTTFVAGSRAQVRSHATL
jgi:hypothetical protein